MQRRHWLAEAVVAAMLLALALAPAAAAGTAVTAWRAPAL